VGGRTPARGPRHHWEGAHSCSIEDDHTSLMPVAPARSEEAAHQTDLGEFRTPMTDEGDRQQTPSRQAEREIAEESVVGVPKPRKRKKR
jgi:hypothetical protein